MDALRASAPRLSLFSPSPDDGVRAPRQREKGCADLMGACGLRGYAASGISLPLVNHISFVAKCIEAAS